MTQTISGDAQGPVAKAADSGPVSRGYTEEMEHWAWLIRNGDPQDTDVKAHPRCRPEVAMGDGIIALTCNVAIQRSMTGASGYIRRGYDPAKLIEDLERAYAVAMVRCGPPYAQ